MRGFVVRRSGLAVLGGLVVLVAGYFVASRAGALNALKARYFPKASQRVVLSAGDFPAGVAAPVGDLASVPLRPVRIGFVPRGSAASLLIGTGGAVADGPERPGKRPSGLFKTAYALDVQAVVFSREADLEKALAYGDVDLALLSVDRVAEWYAKLRDAAPRVEMLVGRSRGQEALAAVGLSTLAALKGKRLAVYRESSGYYFALWLLSRAGLAPSDVRWVWLKSSLEAGRALREGRADAVVGLLGDVELAAKDRDGKVIATTADAPHLIATVLVSRGDFAARYPDAIRRLMRGLFDAAAQLQKDKLPGARLLGEVAPSLGDPRDAIDAAPPASLKDNLGFFGLSGEAPVTYDELFQSAGQLFQRLSGGHALPAASDTRDLEPLKYVAEARGP